MKDVAPQLTNKTNVMPMGQTGVLQRKCAGCGNHTVAGGECAECGEKKGLLQRKAAGMNGVSEASPIVHKVLGSSGQPLDKATRSFLEPRFGYDFSGVCLFGGERKHIQAKLKVNESNDKYEQEADKIADLVMSKTEVANQKLPVAVNPVQTQQVSRDCSGKASEVCTSLLSEEVNDTKDEFLQSKECSIHPAELNPVTESRIQAMRGHGQPLSASTRAFFEPRFGYDFSHVRVHTSGEATSATHSVNARAFTIGQDIVFSSGEYTPETTTGKKLLAHELTHVLQQQNAVSNTSAFWVQRDDPKNKTAQKKTPSNEGEKKKKPKAQLFLKTEAEAKEIVEHLKILGIEVDEPVKAKNVWIVNYQKLSGKEARAEAEKKRKGNNELEAGSDYDQKTDTHYAKIFLKCPEGVKAKPGYHIWRECFTKGNAKKNAEAKKQKLIEGYGAAELFERPDASGYALYYKALTDKDLTEQQVAATKQLELDQKQQSIDKCPAKYTDKGNFKVTTYNLALEKEASTKTMKKDPCGLQGNFRDQFLSRVVVEGSGVSLAGDFVHYDYCKQKNGNKCPIPCYRIAPCAETKSVTCATIGRTVAVDPAILSLGSDLFIEGVGYRIAEDIGGKITGKHIDVYRGLLSHDEANKLTMPGKPKVCKK